MVKVYTFNDPSRLYDELFYNEIKNEINIFSSYSYMKYFAERYCVNDEFIYTLPFNKLINNIFKQYNSSEDKLTHFFELSIILKEDFSDERNNIFKKNKSELLETMYELRSIGITTEMLNRIENKSELEDVFSAIYERMEEHHSFRKIDKLFSKIWSISEYECIIEELLKQDRNHQEVNHNNKLVFHGFYFITPQQQKVMKSMEAAGFEIIFINYYDQRYHSMFDFMKSFISDRNGWTDNWRISHILTPTNQVTNDMLSFYKYETKRSDDSSKEIIVYNSIYEFINQRIIPIYGIPGNNCGTMNNSNQIILAVNSNQIDQYIEEFYLDFNKDNLSFKQTQIGKFILNIHKLLDNNRIVFTDALLKEIFSSGWLQDKSNGSNARDLMSELDDILPYFIGCKTNKEWLNRAEQLRNVITSIIPKFDIGTNRLDRLINNPFSNISYINIESIALEKIIRYMEQISKICSLLFTDEKIEKIKISDYFTNLEKVIFDDKKVHNDDEIVLELRNRLKKIKSESMMLIEDVYEAILFYLSDSNKENELIIPFIDIDGLIFKDNINVFATGFDDLGLPFNEFQYPWPLTYDSIIQLSEFNEFTSLLIRRNKAIKDISRYLIFLLFQHLDKSIVEYSYSKNTTREIQPQICSYFKQMNFIEKYQLSEKVIKPIGFTNIKPRQIDEKHKLIIYNNKSNLLDDIFYKIAYLEDPTNFIDNYIFSSRKMHRDIFAHTFYCSKVSNIFQSVKRYSADEKKKQLKIIFPHLSNAQIIYIYKKSIRYRISTEKHKLMMKFPYMTNEKYNEYLDVIDDLSVSQLLSDRFKSGEI